MFKKDEKINDFNEAETIIGESVQVKGQFENNGNVVINGSLDGEMKTKGAILIGEKAKITANIQAEEMVVEGDVKGDIKVFGYLSIKETAKILGDIECLQISIEKGAEINGNLSISNKTKEEDIKETASEELQFAE